MRDALERYALEATLLSESLGRVTTGGVIEHIAAVGAASVPELGIPAALEIALTVWPFPLGDGPRNALISLGYEPFSGFEGESEQGFVHEGKETRLIITQVGGDSFTSRVILRDFLRHSPEARQGFLERYPLRDDSPEAEAFLQDAQRWWVDFHGFSPVARVAQELHDFSQPWFFSSGWALDIFLGCVTRVHHDVDVVVARSAIEPIRRYLNQRGWQFVMPLDGRLEPWPPESAQAPDIQLHAHREGEMIDILLSEMDAQTWHYRRDPRITCPASLAFLYSEAGLPYLAPELALLFKSKNTSHPQEPRPQDEGDFRRVLPQLSLSQGRWLRKALMLVEPEHGWLELL